MWKTISPEQMDGNIFSMLDREWMLITAGSAQRLNTMTASWGGFGVLWGKPTATCYVRPQRYTREFLDESEYFTLSFYDETYRRALALCGSKSGREVDKAAACGFTVAEGAGGAPYFEQARLVIVCRKRFVQRMDPAQIPEDVKQAYYPEKDYHYIYIGEIVEVKVKGEA